MTSHRTIAVPGELRAALLALFESDRDHLDVVSAAPGLLPSGWAGHADLARAPSQVLSMETATAHREALLHFLAADVDRLPMSDEWWELIQTWIDALRAGGPRIRYLERDLVHTRAVCRGEETYVPGGPLGAAGSEHDLDLVLSGREHERARAWAQGLFERAEDMTGDVERILVESWAGDMLTPEDLYLKVLAEYFEPMLNEMDVGADDNPMLERLTDFQRSAYQAAKGILRRYGGVFLADVVGLGKTYIAMALISWLERTYDQRAVVIAPPKVLDQWRVLAEEFRVDLQRVSMGKLDDLEHYSRREVVVIDESHNFRNRSTLRYETLDRWLRPDGIATRRVLLLSATPQNNAPEDVQRQLALFPDTAARLPYAGESLDDFFRRVRAGEANLSELLTHVLVRRTRRFIQENYPDATVTQVGDDGQPKEVPLEFPERVSGDAQCLRYRIDEAYGGGLYEHVMGTLRDMHYPLHDLLEYVAPENLDDPRLAGLRQAGRSIRGLYRILLLKRLESSVHAFRISLSRLCAKLETSLERLTQQGVVELRRRPDQVDEEGDELGETIALEAELFNREALAAAIAGDLESVRALERAVDHETGHDAKVDRLREYLAARPPAQHRTLIFTSFNDTAEYLRDQLGQTHGRTAYVSGSTGGVLETAARFAPRAMRAEVAPEDQLDLLISTDVLSEGINLQDADTLINYDLHWNPVRLIQRAGRIDRIGSVHEEIHIASFMPERGLEAGLGLETVLRRRIQEFLEVFGGDSAVLPAEELPDPDRAIPAYTGEAFIEAERADETDGMSRHFERLNALRRQDPERLEELRAMRPGKRAASTHLAPAIAAYRLGWFWTFYEWPTDLRGTATPLANDLRGLDALHGHARSDAAERPDHSRFSPLVAEARADFEKKAEVLRQQRTRPQLSPAEQFILRKLDEYRMLVPAAQRPRVEEVHRWVMSGRQNLRLRRLGRQWQRIGLHASGVFQETLALHRRFPPGDEELGEIELSGIVVGYAASTD
jgi:superfamily II DNA or RNA helicase